MTDPRREREEDDGRTIADMSGLGRPTLFGPQRERRELSSAPEEEREERPWEEAGRISGADRKWYIFGALKAALLIAAVFIVVFGLLIWALLALWT